MKSLEYYQLLQLAALLEQVTPILGRFLEEEVPVIVADENRNDLRGQLSLPLADPDEPSRPYLDSFPDYNGGIHEDSI